MALFETNQVEVPIGLVPLLSSTANHIKKIKMNPRNKRIKPKGSIWLLRKCRKVCVNDYIYIHIHTETFV